MKRATMIALAILLVAAIPAAVGASERSIPRRIGWAGQAPAVAFNEAGSEFFVVWVNRISETDSAVWGRRVSATGAPLGDAREISGPGAEATDVAVAWNSVRDQYLVVWTDFSLGSETSSCVVGRRVRANGNPIDSDIQIGCCGYEDNPDVAYSPLRNRYLVVYGGPSMSGQRISANGLLVGSRISVSSEAGNEPAVAYNTINNLFQVVWQTGYLHSDSDINAQRVRPNGGLIGSNFAIADSPGNQVEPDIAFNPERKEFFVVWADNRNTTVDVYGRRTSAYGVLRGVATRLSDGADDERVPAVDHRSTSNQYLAVWDDWDDATPGVIGRVVSQLGSPVGGAISIADTTTARTPAVAANDSADDLLTVWRSGAIWGRVWP